MFFDILLLSACLLPGKYTHGEGKVKIEVTPKEGETILLFSIDGSERKQKFLNLLGIGQQQKICDVIVFYAKGETRTICFVELKGSDLPTATEQVKETYELFKNIKQYSQENTQMRRYYPSFNLNFNFTVKAYIKLNSSSPQEENKYKKELANVFKPNNYRISSQEDISQFIRGIDDSEEQAEKIKKKKNK